MFDQTNDAELFREAASLQADGFKLRGNRWVKGKATYLPLYEAKMFRPYDHRHGSVYEETQNWINQGQTVEATLVEHQNPERLAQPRWWVDVERVVEVLGSAGATSLLAFRDITRSTDVRTFIATQLPVVGAINTAPLMVLDGVEVRRQLCLLACLNSIALDYVAKQKAGHIHMNFFIVEQLPIPAPDAYDKPCPWSPRTKLEKWISERVLKLTCTAEDMLPLAEACDFTGGSFQQEYGGRLNKWDPEERARLMAELDAAYFHLYGIDRNDAEYILSPFKGIHDRSELFGDHRSTAEHILDLYDQYAGA
jgi:hypothetical protein